MKYSFIFLFYLFAVTSCKKDLPTTDALPTCFDLKQNGEEIGLDCGGNCDSCLSPVACFTIDTIGKLWYEDNPVFFTNCSKFTFISKWEFGDGSISFKTSPNHTYSEGTYIVKLTSIGADTTKKDVVGKKITISNKNNGDYFGKECGVWSLKITVSIIGQDITLSGLNQGKYTVYGKLTSPTTFDIPDQKSTENGIDCYFVGHGSFINGALDAHYGFDYNLPPKTTCFSAYKK
jgi:hypothetical protein